MSSFLYILYRNHNITMSSVLYINFSVPGMLIFRVYCIDALINISNLVSGNTNLGNFDIDNTEGFLRGLYF